MTPADLPTFVLKPAADFWWEVRIPIATDTDYSFAKLDVLYANVPQAEFDKMRGIGLADEEKPPSDEQIALRVVRGWRNLPDETGQQVVFSEAALRQLMDAPMVRNSLVGTFMAARNGMAARKNA